MFVSIKYLLLIIHILYANCSIKIWSPVPEDWVIVGANEICARSKTVFNKQLDGVLFVNEQREEELNLFVLPADGALVLQDYTTIHFSNSKNCPGTDKNNYLIFDQSYAQKWFSPQSWTTKYEEINVATPHLYRIPCECDTVEFRIYNGIRVDLDFVDEIVIDKFAIENSVDESINNIDDDFNTFLETQIGQKMFLNSEAVQFTKGFCTPRKYCGCHNPKRFKQYKELVCQEEHCELPHCVEPVHPLGHCCPICGALLNFKINDTCAFETEMDKMKEMVGKKLKRFRNGKYLNKIHFHMGVGPSSGNKRNDNIAELVLAEVGEYTSISVEFMNFLTKDFNEYPQRVTIVSGIPFVPGQSSIFLIIGLTLLFVLSLFTMMYVHYIHEPKYETWVPISRLNILRKSVAFARFDNRHADGDDGDAVDVSLKFNDDGILIEKTVTDFNNPLFQNDATTEGSSTSDIGIGMIETNVSKISDDREIGHGSDFNLVDINLNSSDE